MLEWHFRFYWTSFILISGGTETISPSHQTPAPSRSPPQTTRLSLNITSPHRGGTFHQPPFPVGELGKHHPSILSVSSQIWWEIILFHFLNLKTTFCRSHFSGPSLTADRSLLFFRSSNEMLNCSNERWGDWRDKAQLIIREWDPGWRENCIGGSDTVSLLPTFQSQQILSNFSWNSSMLSQAYPPLVTQIDRQH